MKGGCDGLIDEAPTKIFLLLFEYIFKLMVWCCSDLLSSHFLPIVLLSELHTQNS